MEKITINFGGNEYEARVISLPPQLGGFRAVVADVELWFAIEEATYDEEEPNYEEATEIDNEIYYYLDSGVLSDNMTDEEIIKYLEKHILTLFFSCLNFNKCSGIILNKNSAIAIIVSIFKLI